MNSENIITTTWLPIFPGFYDTIFDCNGLYYKEEEWIKNTIKPEALATAMLENMYNSDAVSKLFSDYKLSVARQLTELIEKELKILGLVEKAEFEQIVSPREYNFVNDAIDVTFTITPENLLNIKKFVAEHFEDWKLYLKERYTGYDGFIPYYSNNPEDEEWNLDNAIKSTHHLGSVLNFLCYVDGIDSGVLFYHYEEDVSLDLDAMKKECIEKGWYSPPNFCIDWIKALYYKIRNRSVFRITRVRFPRGIFQLRITTWNETYFFAITKKEVSNPQRFKIKRFFKYLIFSKLR